MYAIRSYYDTVRQQAPLLERAIAGIQSAYVENVFPEMKIVWGGYPNHIGHTEDLGCFRCHDEAHETQGGEVISMDCETCHVILAEDEKDPAILKTLYGQ